MAKGNTYVGTVEPGSQRAALLGYPTINIMLAEAGVSGVYVAKVFADGKEYIAAAFADPARKILEAHMLDFSGDLYGHEATIELCEKIREGRSFSNNASLKAAIEEDVAKVRKHFKN